MYCLFWVVLCIVCCVCTLYYCHRVATQLKLTNISYILTRNVLNIWETISFSRSTLFHAVSCLVITIFMLSWTDSGQDQIPHTHTHTHTQTVRVYTRNKVPPQAVQQFWRRVIKTDCSNYRGISLLPTTYKILSNILLSRLPPYAEEMIVDHQCGFKCNRSATEHIFCICQIL